jgi:hypothetical protein
MNMTFWETHFYSVVLENKDEIYKEWKPHLDNTSNFSSPWSLGNCESTIRSDSNTDLPWKIFFDSIQPHVNTYLESLDPIVPYSIYCDEHWANVYSKGNFQEPHDHAFPGRGLSAIYIMEIPIGDDVGGQLVFDCPNFATVRSSGMDRIFNAYNYQHIMPKLEPGTLIFFPSWVPHYVLPSNTDQRRATLAANFVIRAEDKNE